MQDDETIVPDDTLPLGGDAQRRIALTVAVAELRADDVGAGQYRIEETDRAPRVVYDWSGSSPAPIAEIDDEGIHAHPGAIDRHHHPAKTMAPTTTALSAVRSGTTTTKTLTTNTTRTTRRATNE